MTLCVPSEAMILELSAETDKNVKRESSRTCLGGYSIVSNFSLSSIRGHVQTHVFELSTEL